MMNDSPTLITSLSEKEKSFDLYTRLKKLGHNNILTIDPLRDHSFITRQKSAVIFVDSNFNHPQELHEREIAGSVVFVHILKADMEPAAIINLKPYEYLSGSFSDRELELVTTMALNEIRPHHSIRINMQKIPVSAFSVNSNGDIVEWNASSNNLFGFNNYNVGANIRTMFPGETRYRQVVAKMRRVRDEGSVESIAFAHNPDSGLAYIESVIVPLKNPNDSELRCCFLNIDVSRYKAGETELIESSEKYRLLVENTHEGIAILQGEKFIYANPTILEELGYSEEELNGIKFLDLVHPSYRDNTLELFQFTLETGASIRRFCVPITNRHEEMIWVEISGERVEWDDKPAIIAFFNEVTEKINQQKELEEKEEKYKQLMHHAPSGIFEVEIPSARFLEVNDVICDATGYSRSELLEMTSLELLKEEGIKLFAERMEKVFRGETVIENPEFEIVTKNGDTYWVTLNVRFISKNGVPVRASVVVHDITGRKETEEAMRAALLEKDVLLREVHHRVKNNMQVISSLLNLQSRTFRDQDFQKVFRDIQNRVNAMALTQELLYQSKSLAEISLEQYVNRLCSALTSSFSGMNKEIRILIDIKDISIGIDYAAPIGLVINELVSNAFKYAFPGRTKGVIVIKADLNDQGITLIIRDDGVGLPDDLDKIQNGKLGLSLVTSLVERQLKGAIEWFNNDGANIALTFKTLNPDKN